MSDAQVRELADEALFGSKALLEAWADLLLRETPGDTARHYVAKALIDLARPDRALEILGEDDSIRGRQLRALALSDRANDRDERESIKILRGLWERDRGAHSDAELAETGGLLGGRYKKWYRRDGSSAWLERAFDTYREAWEQTRDPYPGINCAALALELGKSEESREAARAVLRVLEDADGHDEWHHATKGEALLLLADPEDEDSLAEPRESYKLAVKMNPSALRKIATMRRQARVELGLLGFPDQRVLDDAFPLKTVAAFSGHRVDAPGRPVPRFTPQMEGAVRREIRGRLEQANVGFGIASGAQGADILFLEEVLRGGGAAKVVLPFPLKSFKASSVGDDWGPRLDRILADPMVQLIELLDETPAGDGLVAAFSDCNARIRGEALGLAGELDQEPRLIAVWDGHEGDGGGGTADAVAAWQRESLEVDIIPLGGTKGRAGGKKPLVQRGWMPQARYCLAVGIDQYTSLARLYNAQQDARAIADVMQEQHGFQSMKVMGEEATLIGISNAFRETLMPKVTADDLVVVYYSGHGEVKDGGYYLSTYDAEEDPPNRWIDFALLREWSATLPCRQLLWIFDSCHSGMLFRIVIEDLEEPDPRWARLALTSGRQVEEVRDGLPGEGSPFANSLLTAMRSGPPKRHHPDAFTADELGIFLKHDVSGRAQQTPQYVQLSDHEGGDIVFQVPRGARVD